MAVRSKGANYVFLPGGHVETAESAPKALIREMKEEAGRTCEVKAYLGAIENSWMEKETRHWEITHFFEVIIPDIAQDSNIVSQEPHFDFLWLTPEELETARVLPVPLPDMLRRFAQGDRSIWWGSTMGA